MRMRLFSAVTCVLAAATWLRGQWEDFLLLLPPRTPPDGREGGGP